jgi:Ca2+/Na+ antiporter/tetratricopeptide (TPR) repeat protein
MLTHNRLNAYLAFTVFLISELVYVLTMAPTFSFWDCGEFVAVAYTLGVPHPPGTPIFTVLGRLFTMIPIGDIGARVNLISTLFSALTVMITYLVIIRFIRIYRQTPPDEWSLPEKISAYSAGVIGAFALAFSDSFWFNAVEAEVYAMSMFFNTVVVWLILKWYEVADEEGNEKWILLIAYAFGLALGVHLQALLAFFAIAMVYYYKRYEISVSSFATLVVVSSAIFFVIYPGIVKGLPALMRDVGIWFMFVLVIGLIYAIYYTHQNKLRLWNLAAVSLLLIMIGYSSFTVIYFRSQTNPPINENAPNTLEKLYSYLNREQYGDYPVFKRRWSQDPQHQQNYQKYSSDMDFFLKYQVVHLYLRYFGWQFIGRYGDVQDDGIDFSKFWGIPFGIGLFGMFYHFRRQWNMALVVLALLLLTGVFINIYTNPPEPQPRERDYVYVGSFFAFAIWIGIGIDALFETIRESLKEEKKLVPATVGLCLFGLLFVNGRMLQVNYHSHDRSGNYAPWDYAYNLLNSCAKDGILFTNGDNDTFPLWYLQEVAGVRQDVRVVNLSLANTDWYVRQLIYESPRGAKPIKMNISERELKNFGYEQWSARTVSIPVPAWAKEEVMRYDEGKKLKLNLDSNATAIKNAVDTVQWTFEPYIKLQSGQGYIRAQDRVVYETLVNNLWERPVYFAVTVADNNRIGVDNYLRMDGFAYRVVPVKTDNYGYFEPEIMWDKLMNVYRYERLDDPTVYYDENTRRMVSNYRTIMLQLAQHYAQNPNGISTIRNKEGNLKQVSNKELATQLLDKSLSILPSALKEMDYRILQAIIQLYSKVGGTAQIARLLPDLEDAVDRRLRANPSDLSPRYVLATAYRSVGEYDKAITILQSLSQQYSQDSFLKKELEDTKAQAQKHRANADTTKSFE